MTELQSKLIFLGVASQNDILSFGAIAFSLGAIVLILCVIIQNVNTKRKLKRAEELKRERIKRFSTHGKGEYVDEQIEQPDNKTMKLNKVVSEETYAPMGASMMASTMPSATMSNGDGMTEIGPRISSVEDTAYREEKGENISDLVRRRIQEIENEKRSELIKKQNTEENASGESSMATLPTAPVKHAVSNNEPIVSKPAEVNVPSSTPSQNISSAVPNVPISPVEIKEEVQPKVSSTVEITKEEAEYNIEYMREIQGKLYNKPRRYMDEAILKQEEKRKLQDELYDKKLQLELMKKKQEEKNNKVYSKQRKDMSDSFIEDVKPINNETIKTEEVRNQILTEVNQVEVKPEIIKEQPKEEINIETNNESLVYKEGQKVDLFSSSMPQILNDRKKALDDVIFNDLDSELRVPETKVEEIKVPEPKAEEIKVPEPKAEEIKNPEPRVHNVTIPQPKVQEVKVEEKSNINTIETVKENADIKPIEVKEEKVIETPIEQPEHLYEEVTKEDAEVLNQIENLFANITIEENEIDEASKPKENIQKSNNVNKISNKAVVNLSDRVINDTAAAGIAVKNIKKVDSNNDKVKEIIGNIKDETTDEAQKARLIAKITQKENKVENKVNIVKEADKNQKPKVAPPRGKNILENVNIDEEIAEKKRREKLKSDVTSNMIDDYRKIFVVVSPDNCGKTTIAVNLAFELANMGVKTVLIDTDNKKKDIYYYIQQNHLGCLSRLNEFDTNKELFDLGIKVKENLTVFTENKGIDLDINYNKLYKIIKYAHETNEAVIIDVKAGLGQEKTKDLLKMATNILMVVDKRITTVNRLADKFAKIKGGFMNKKVDVVINMDEGQKGINRATIKGFLKRLEYIDNGVKKNYSIQIRDIFSVANDTESVITGLLDQLPAITVPDNKMITDIKRLATYYFKSKNNQ